jgi:hypothetical protein
VVCEQPHPRVNLSHAARHHSAAPASLADRAPSRQTPFLNSSASQPLGVEKFIDGLREFRPSGANAPPGERDFR